MVRVIGALAVLLLAAVLASCGQPEGQDDPVLARVEGEDIRRSDLDAAWERTFSETDALFADETMERRLLESLVATRVMAREAEKAMSEAELESLERTVRAWRDEQLVKRYLADQVTPEPVSNAMVEEYYASHPELFGGGERRLYEVLEVERAASEELRNRAVSALAQAAASKDWQAFARKHSRDGLVVDYRRGRADAATADKGLLARLNALGTGQTSAISMDGGRVSVLRVTAIEKAAPKPLVEVRDDIRRRLAPVKLKAAVKQVMDKVLEQAKVEYTEPREG